ncbi:hypothetical protein AR687_03620 [Flavobacteriaceae bacterium CRH]|jgi:hypothetical protein|nr:hypothetical protein AR687_03620 [Flavobacteriaceae bacterium CRH]
MKKITQLLLILPFLLFSCSSDDDSSENNETNPEAKPEFAMTATINGKEFKANNPYGTNLYSSTNIWSYYPKEDFVMLQGRQGGVFGDPEINIWLKRTDIKVGTYKFTIDEESPATHAIDLTDNSNEEFEETKEGSITITEVNTKTKVVKGKFNFTTYPGYDEVNKINFTITNGTFNYQYEDIK